MLCLGVVVPYHEFVSPQRLTDETWRGMLDCGDAPPVAEGVREFYRDDELPKAEADSGGDD